MKCHNEKCPNEATLQFDHNGELVFYCDDCFQAWSYIMLSMGAFIPTAYPIGTKIK